MHMDIRVSINAFDRSFYVISYQINAFWFHPDWSLIPRGKTQFILKVMLCLE